MGGDGKSFTALSGWQWSWSDGAGVEQLEASENKMSWRKLIRNHVSLEQASWESRDASLGWVCYLFHFQIFHNFINWFKHIFGRVHHYHLLLYM